MKQIIFGGKSGVINSWFVIYFFHIIFLVHFEMLFIDLKVHMFEIHVITIVITTDHFVFKYV